MSFKRYLPYLYIALMVSAVLSVSLQLGLFAAFERYAEDRLFVPREVDPRIVIVAIDDISITNIGQWPWPRAVYAEFFKRLETTRPRAVAFDVMLSETSRQGVADDASLARALKEVSYPIIFPVEAVNPEVVEGQAKSGVEVIPRSEFLSNKNVKVGGVNLILDADGVARRFPRELSIPFGTAPHFAEIAVLASEFSTPSTPREPVERIVFAGSTGTFPRVSFVDALEGRADLTGKLVFVGSTASDLHDEAPTPTSRGILMPGVEIHAMIANQFLQGISLRGIAYSWMVLWIFLAALSTSLLFFFLRRVIVPALASVGIFILSVLLAALVFDRGLVVNLVHSALAPLFTASSSVLYKNVLGERRRREIENAFSKHVSKDVLREILKDPSGIKLGGEERTVTILFSDIRSFTTLSESISAPELVSVLNRYFTEMTDEILKNDGVVDKFIGDAIMAFWGAPASDEHQADKAIRAAKGMLTRLSKLNERLRADGMKEIKIGIGLYTGPAVAGNVGSIERFNYTVIGDTVNVASRLEGVTKEVGVPLLVGESTKTAAKEKWDFEQKGEVKVKGREQPIKIYAVL